LIDTTGLYILIESYVSVAYLLPTSFFISNLDNSVQSGLICPQNKFGIPCISTSDGCPGF